MEEPPSDWSPVEEEELSALISKRGGLGSLREEEEEDRGKEEIGKEMFRHSGDNLAFFQKLSHQYFASYISHKTMSLCLESMSYILNVYVLLNSLTR